MVEKRPLSTGEVARLLHVTPVCVLRWIRAGKLPAYRFPGGHFRVARAEFRKFLASNHIPLKFDSSPPKRILVVDDEDTVGDAFEAALKAKGHEVVVARSGREALRSVRQDHFDLIFLDVLLPTPSGASILRAIKRQDPEAVVVLVTGYPDHEETLAALQYGPAMLLPKPVKVSDIYAVLKIVFKEKVDDQSGLDRPDGEARERPSSVWQRRGARR